MLKECGGMCCFCLQQYGTRQALTLIQNSCRVIHLVSIYTSLVNTNKLAAESGYHSPDPWVQVLGCAIEAEVVVEEVETMALVDTGSQISALTEGFITEMGLKILPLRNVVGGVLHLKGMGGILIPYKRIHRG